MSKESEKELLEEIYKKDKIINKACEILSAQHGECPYLVRPAQSGDPCPVKQRQCYDYIYCWEEHLRYMTKNRYYPTWLTRVKRENEQL